MAINGNETTAAANEASQHIVDLRLRRRHARRLLTMDGLDLADEQTMRDAWRRGAA